MINLNKLGIHFGRQVLFENVTLQMNKGNRYGLVGANGSGKSTLLKLIAREQHPEAGEIEYSPALKIGVLQQDQYLYDTVSILDVVLMGRLDLWKALQEKQKLTEMGDVSEENGQKLAELEMKIADQKGYEAEPEAAELLSGLGISVEKQNDPLNTLSGGYKLRVLLAQCLFSEPDFLLLDEPTNHLDLLSIIWLEEYLCKFKGTCLIISHDQYFLNRISTHIVDIDYETIKVYTGNYDQFVESKELERTQKEKEITQQEKKKDEIKQFVTRFKAKATKARQANSKMKQLDRMEEIVIRRSSRKSPNFSFDIIRPSGKIIFTLKNLSKSFGEHQVIKDLSIKLERGEKLAVIGANGIGKSTLLKMLVGTVEATKGSIEQGYEVHPGYCPQDHREMIPSGSTPFEWLYSFAPGETIGTIRGLLARVLIQGDDVDKDTDSLSGGESARLIFSRLMLQRPNLMLLDEPTNHMDIESLESLSESLQKYEGSIVCVSHDRRFIETFATSILELRHDGYELFKGTYHEFLEKKGFDYFDRTSVRLENRKKKDKKEKKLQNQEWRELSKEKSSLERQVTAKEKEVAGIEQQLSVCEERLSQEEIYKEEKKRELEQEVKKKAELDKKLSVSMAEWEALSENLSRVKKSLEVEG
ncbi:ATP-binding cassette domain-containing protein [bacterium]|nr:ATP-binding cassette domain-containing protein [bacterium]